MKDFVAVSHIKKSFGVLQVLRGVSFTIEQGQYVAIMGPSGSGKTTLLQLLGLLDKPDEGDICIGGQSIIPLKGKQEDRFRASEVGFVFQFHELLPELTALENCMLPALIVGKKNDEASALARTLLGDLGLSARLSHKPYQLSGGEKQRIAVARALINRPALLLADEPSGSLDKDSKEELHSLLEEVKNRWGQTIIVVTHDERLAERADRLLLLENGLIVEKEQ